jgi:hypothetical protein
METSVLLLAMHDLYRITLMCKKNYVLCDFPVSCEQSYEVEYSYSWQNFLSSLPTLCFPKLKYSMYVIVFNVYCILVRRWWTDVKINGLLFFHQRNLYVVSPIHFIVLYTTCFGYLVAIFRRDFMQSESESELHYNWQSVSQCNVTKSAYNLCLHATVLQFYNIYSY